MLYRNKHTGRVAKVLPSDFVWCKLEDLEPNGFPYQGLTEDWGKKEFEDNWEPIELQGVLFFPEETVSPRPGSLYGIGGRRSAPEASSSRIPLPHAENQEQAEQPQLPFVEQSQ